MHRVWKRISEGRDVAVVGGEPPAPPPDYDRAVIRVVCSPGGLPLGPWREAQLIAERIGGSGLAGAGERLREGLRRRLLPEGSDGGGSDALIGALSQVHRGVLVMTGLEVAPPATLQLLAEVVRRPGWLGIPILMAFNREPDGDAARVLVELARRDGAEAVVRIAPNQPLSLPRNPHVRLVLRAAALVGPAFDVDTVARLVERSPLRVLEALQEAVDHDIAINDLGEGRFELLASDADELRRRTLPSLVGAWATRLTGRAEPERHETASECPDPVAPPARERPGAEAAAPGAGEGAGQAPPEPDGLGEAASSPAEPSGASFVATPEAPIGRIGPDAARMPPNLAVVPEPVRPADPIDLSPRGAPDAEQRPTIHEVEAPPSASEATPDDGAPAATPPREAPGVRVERPRLHVVGGPRSRTGRRPSIPQEEAGFTEHHEGHVAEPELRPGRPTLSPPDPDQMVERLLRRAREVAATGDPVQAVALGRQALSLLEQLPPDEQRRRRRIDLLVGLGHLQAEAPGPAPDFSLQAAIAAVEAAESLLLPGDPAELRASIRRLLATICYEAGDPASLERALSLLSTAIRELANAGDPIGAARLLNDQAAVWVRLGDPVRAAHLLRESRGVFSGRAARDPSARVELAETEHLLARLPLHVRARPGQEADSLLQAMEHALSAEASYRAVGEVRESARVWETLARLCYLAGQRDEAADWLTRAGKVQQEIGDLLGLARTSDALAALLKGAGRVDQAVLLLTQSIEINAEKGSALGLAYNRRALEALVGESSEEHRPAIDAALHRLAAAEEVFGRIELPPHAELPL